jgi:hypothetical protein
VGSRDDIPTDVVLIHGNLFFYDGGRYAYKLQAGEFLPGDGLADDKGWRWRDVKLEAA